MDLKLILDLSICTFLASLFLNLVVRKEYISVAQVNQEQQREKLLQTLLF